MQACSDSHVGAQVAASEVLMKRVEFLQGMWARKAGSGAGAGGPAAPAADTYASLAKRGADLVTLLAALTPSA